MILLLNIFHLPNHSSDWAIYLRFLDTPKTVDLVGTYLTVNDTDEFPVSCFDNVILALISCILLVPVGVNSQGLLMRLHD